MYFKNIKNIALYYFSGTGNTLFVSNLYIKELLLKSISVDMIPIETIDVSKSQAEYEMLVIAFPVHGFKAPQMVEKFISNLPTVSTNKPVLLLATCGGMVGASFSSLRKKLLDKKYNVVSTYFYSMPDNVSFMFSKDLIEEKLISTKISLVKDKIRVDFNSLYSGQENIIKVNIFNKLFSNIVNYFLNKSLTRKKWVVDYDKCTLCGICERGCPTQNIVVKKQKREVKFSNKCIMCTKCYNMCPFNAINYKSSKTKNYRRYNLFKKEILK